MMPRTVEMHQRDETVVLDGPAVRWLIDALHQPDLGHEGARCPWEGGGPADSKSNFESAHPGILRS